MSIVVFIYEGEILDKDFIDLILSIEQSEN